MADKMSSYAPHMAKNISVEPMVSRYFTSMTSSKLLRLMTDRKSQDLKEAKWITLKKITYQDPSGRQRLWESAERQTRPTDSEVDAVGIVAILTDPKSTSGPSLLLQKQFRPALNKVTIESPSGLIDAGESPTEAALRELREETGYHGTIPSDSSAAEGFIMHNDPGFTNTNTKMIFVDVDMSDPRNQDPKPELEDGEFIECFTLPLVSLWEDLRRLDGEGYAVDARVGGLAQGMEVARRWRSVFEKES